MLFPRLQTSCLAVVHLGLHIAFLGDHTLETASTRLEAYDWFLLGVDICSLSIADGNLCHLTTGGKNRNFHKFSMLCVSPYSEWLNSRGGREGPNTVTEYRGQGREHL